MMLIIFILLTLLCHLCDRAEAETKAKLEKVAEIKRVNAQMMAIKSEISKYEDTLKEYQLYKKFLSSVTPKVCFNISSLSLIVVTVRVFFTNNLSRSRFSPDKFCILFNAS
jgi:uncharacterized protein YlxW (UPF0749 family)